MQVTGRESSQVCFTCGSCGDLHFASSQAQREHYQSDYHRYNLKRKVAGLPPVQISDFEARQALLQQTLQQETDALRHSKKDKIQCQYCDKKFPSEKGLKNHYASGRHPEVSLTELTLGSQKLPNRPDAALNHAEMVLRQKIWHYKLAGDEEPFFKSIEALKELIDNRLQLAAYHRCLFCPLELSKSASDMTNEACQLNLLRHMSRQHSFFLPDPEYLSDLTGLLSFLHEKIELFATCLYCQKDYINPSAVRKHMLDKGHTMIGSQSIDDDDNEIYDFYDYTRHDAIDADDDEFEDLDDADFEDVECDDVASLEETQDVAVDAGDELILPSGKRLGHRALRLYYRQNIRLDSNELPLSLTDTLVTPDSQQQQQLSLPRQRIEQLREAHRTTQSLSHIYQASSGLKSKPEVANQRVYLRQLAKKQQQLGIRGNAFQPHFREQIL